jgi:hypothetical protein
MRTLCAKRDQEDQMNGNRMLKALVVMPLLSGAGLLMASAPSGGTPPPSEHVSMSGTDSGNCVSSPCATITFALSKATPGETIHVAAGSYNQTVNITKAINIVGAGASSTTINGSGLDPYAMSDGLYGVVYVGNAGGQVTVNGFTITNPFPYSYTGGEPEAVALADTNASDNVNIINDTITEGTQDANAGTDFPIGIDGFLNAATTTITGDTISGFFQGALLEDNGPATVNSDQFKKLIANTDNSTSPPTVYPAEGLFFLADEGGTYSGQVATQDKFSHYSGYGIAEDAGYSGGYVTPGCVANGSIATELDNDTFALKAGPAATGISLTASGTGNSLTGDVTGDTGHVTAPSDGIEIQSVSPTPTPPGTDCGPYFSTSGGGGSVDVVQNNDDITTVGGPDAPAAPAGAVRSTTGALHVPRQHRS